MTVTTDWDISSTRGAQMEVAARGAGLISGTEIRSSRQSCVVSTVQGMKWATHSCMLYSPYVCDENIRTTCVYYQDSRTNLGHIPYPICTLFTSHASSQPAARGAPLLVQALSLLEPPFPRHGSCFLPVVAGPPHLAQALSLPIAVNSQ